MFPESFLGFVLSHPPSRKECAIRKICEAISTLNVVKNCQSFPSPFWFPSNLRPSASAFWKLRHFSPPAWTRLGIASKQKAKASVTGRSSPAFSLVAYSRPRHLLAWEKEEQWRNHVRGIKLKLYSKCPVMSSPYCTLPTISGLRLSCRACQRRRLHSSYSGNVHLVEPAPSRLLPVTSLIWTEPIRLWSTHTYLLSIPSMTVTCPSLNFALCLGREQTLSIQQNWKLYQKLNVHSCKQCELHFCISINNDGANNVIKFSHENRFFINMWLIFLYYFIIYICYCSDISL